MGKPFGMTADWGRIIETQFVCLFSFNFFLFVLDKSADGIVTTVVA